MKVIWIKIVVNNKESWNNRCIVEILEVKEKTKRLLRDEPMNPEKQERITDKYQQEE